MTNEQANQPISPFEALTSGRFEEGLSALIIAAKGPRAADVALGLWYLEGDHSEIFKGLANNVVQKLRLVKMMADRRIEEELKKRRVIIDYPAYPKEDADYHQHQEAERLWLSATGDKSRAVIAAALSKTMVILPKGTRKMVWGGFDDSREFFDGSKVIIDGKPVQGFEIATNGDLVLKAIPVDLTLNRKVEIFVGSYGQYHILSKPEDRRLEERDKLLLTQVTDRGECHVDLTTIIKNSAAWVGVRHYVPFIIDPFGVLQHTEGNTQVPEGVRKMDSFRNPRID